MRAQVCGRGTWECTRSFLAGRSGVSFVQAVKLPRSAKPSKKARISGENAKSFLQPHSKPHNFGKMNSSGFESMVSPTLNQSSPFSITDILSKDKIGQKRSPPSHSVHLSTPVSSSASRAPTSRAVLGQGQRRQQGNSETPKRPRKSSASYATARGSKISLSEAGSIVPSSNFGTHNVPMMVTPHKPLGPPQMNSSLISPFNTNLLLAFSQRPSPSSEERDELFGGEGSLSMLSEVAQYHSELCLSNTEGNSSLEAPMREKMANIRLGSTTDCSDVDASMAEAKNTSLAARKARKTSTPSILKKRKGVLGVPHASTSDESGYVSSRHQATHLDAGFVSPLSSEKSSSAGKNLAFSPSIFLSRPDHMSISDHAPNTTHSSTSSGPTPNKSESSAPPRIRFSVSPGSESDSHALSDTEGASFITSTPIKSGKENTMRGGSDSDEMWSPTILLTKRHRHLKETNESSTGTDSDSVKKPCLRPPHSHRKKSKARTKLSPLLENACSPISKDTSSHHNPSPLTTALATTPTKNVPVSQPRQASTVPPSASTTAMPSSSSTLALSCSTSRTSAPPLPPQHQRPTFIGSNLIAANVGNPTFAQKLLNTTTPVTLNRPFSTVSALLPPNTQLAQPPQSLLHSFSRLQVPLSYPLVSNSALQHYSGLISNQAAATPVQNYLPFVGLMPPPVLPTPPPSQSFLAYNKSYSEGQNSTMDISGYGGKAGSNSSSSSGGRGKDNKQMRSVPPRFIFSNYRSEKRSRLTEAINKSKSLSMTASASQGSKLPTEWTKLACGQTDDQKQLTEKARHFLQSQMRQVPFVEDMDH